MARLEPVNDQLNVAVTTLAARLFPAGYDVGETAPSSLAELNDHIERTGRMLVWNGASDHTIFGGSGEMNWAFRAWHDWAHWRYQLPFNEAGERAAAFVQVAHLVRLYGDDDDVVDMAALVLTEVMGQAQHKNRAGEFPPDQRAFTLANTHRFHPLAQRLVSAFGAIEASDAEAIARAAMWKFTDDVRSLAA
jgi:hypothetical protein